MTQMITPTASAEGRSEDILSKYLASMKDWELIDFIRFILSQDVRIFFEGEPLELDTEMAVILWNQWYWQD